MNKESREILIIPLLVWAGLMVLLFGSLGYAFLKDAPVKLAVGLTIAAAKAALIATIFMQLRKASGLVLVAAASGLFWLSLLFLFSFSDFLTR